MALGLQFMVCVATAFDLVLGAKTLPRPCYTIRGTEAHQSRVDTEEGTFDMALAEQFRGDGSTDRADRKLNWRS